MAAKDVYQSLRAIRETVTVQVNRLGHTWLGWVPFHQWGQPCPGLPEAESSEEVEGRAYSPLLGTCEVAAEKLCSGFTVLKRDWPTEDSAANDNSALNQGLLILWGNWNMRYAQTHWVSCLSSLEKRRLRGHLITTSGSHKGLWGNQIFSMQQKDKRQQSQVAARKV